MGGGGKGGTSTSTVSIPPEVLARYNAVNARAEEVAKTPFQAYGGEFVAPMNEVQQQGVSQTQQYSGAAQPYYQTAAGLTQQAVDATKPLTAAQIQQYQNPYVQSVVDPTLAALRQQQAQDRQAQSAQAIRSGAFGGERAGLQRAVLGGQQELAQAQAISPLYAQAYQQALAAAQQQQGQRVAGLMGAGQQIAGIGTGAQQAGLQGAQAVIGAGTLGQQTKQALDTAQYQQFLQERGYPFQTAQFLANIAEGTGALSGSTTTTTQPTSFFSDERLKHDIKKIGKTNDGLPIYSFKYNGDDRTQIGLMAQDVEKKRPEAVGLAGGYKTVDYAKATAGARHARAAGGLVPSSMGGAVFEPGNYARGGFAGGGLITDPNDLQAILAAQKQSFGPFSAGGLYGSSAQQDPHGVGASYVPKASLPVPKLVTASPASRSQQGGLQSAMQNIATAGSTAKTLGEGYDWAKGFLKDKPATTTDIGKYPSADVPNPPVRPDEFATLAHGGGIMPRHHYGAGGSTIDPYKPPTSASMVPEDVMEDSEATKDRAEGQVIKPDGSRGGGGGGGGGLMGAAQTIGGLYGAAKGIGSFMSWLPTLFLKNGGVVPRHGYQTDGTVQPASSDDSAPAPDFNRAVNRTLQFEGGLNRADTNGTPSMFGINQAAHPDIDVTTLTPDQAKQIYKTQYWDKIGADKMHPNLAHVAYDTAVIAGPSRALNFVQQAGGDPAKLLQIRKDYQDSLIAQDPAKYGKYEKAWNNRLNTLYSDIGSQAPQQPSGMGLGRVWQGIKSAADSVAPKTYTGEDRTMGQFLTSKDFVIPLLTGLGTMASSPSRYLGAAILQGLGGGAQAYAQLQKQQADIQGTEATTQATLANIAKGAAVYGPSGQLTGYRVYINGKVTQIPATEFLRALREGRPYQVAPDVGGFGGASQPAPTQPTGETTQTGGLSGAIPQGQPQGGPATPAAPAAPTVAPYRSLTPEDQKLVKENAEGVMTSNPDKVGKDAAAYTDASIGASNSMSNRPRSLSYAKSLSEMPAKGLVSANAFSAEITTPYMEYVNGLIHTLGGDFNVVRPEDLANAETIKKIAGLQANALSTQSGQHSWSALQSALATTPTQRNTPAGAANLMSDILMQEQLPIDYYSHLDMMKKYAQEKGLVTGEDQAKLLGTGTFKNFMDRYSQQQMQEKQALKEIFLTPLSYKDANGQTVKTSLMSYMISHGGQVPEALRPEIDKKYGPEIYRYFSTAGKGR